MLKIYIIVLTALIFSCNSNNETKNISKRAELVTEIKKDSLPTLELFIDKGDEQGWGADLRLSISEITKTDSSVTYKANSLYHAKNVGFEIILPEDLSGKFTQVMLIKSSGQISNNFLSTLSALYKLKTDSTKQFINYASAAFVDLTEFAKRQLGQDSLTIPETKELKVFFEAENQDDNAEVFININEKQHWLEIREKDEGYRKKVIKFLTHK